MGLFMCSRVNFMCSRGHLCVPDVIYVFQVSCMCSRVHLRVPELIYVFLSSCLCSLCVPDSRMPFCFPDCIDVFHFSFLPCTTGKCRFLPFIRKCPRNLIKWYFIHIQYIYNKTYIILILKYTAMHVPISSLSCPPLFSRETWKFSIFDFVKLKNP